MRDGMQPTPQIIQVNDSVRSWDFPEYLDLPGVGGKNVQGCFVDGIVEDIERTDGIMCYRIRIEASSYNGKPYVYDPPRTHVHVPVNGSRYGMSGVHRHVVRRTT